MSVKCGAQVEQKKRAPTQAALGLGLFPALFTPTVMHRKMNNLRCH